MIPLPLLSESAAFELDDHIAAIRSAQRCEPVADVLRTRDRLISTLATLYSRVHEDRTADPALWHLMNAIERRVPALSVGALDTMTLATMAEQLRAAANRMRAMDRAIMLPSITLKETGT